MTPPTAQSPQYVFLNRAPGASWNQNRPDTVTDDLFAEPVKAVGAPAGSHRRLGLSFIFSYLNAASEHALDQTLRRVLAQSVRFDTPVLIVLDGANWWDARPDLWNWWDPARPGYDPANAANVEWTGWGPRHAVKIAWRNWGRQIRVAPPPNLYAPRFRAACRPHLLRLARIIKNWAADLPAGQKHLYPGIKVGWEASIGINAYHYPGGNRYLEQWPRDSSHDPRHGLGMAKGFAGGLAPLGYAALAAEGKKRNGPITLVDHERLVRDYLRFLAAVCRQARLTAGEIFLHAGGQYAPWHLHYSHRVALVPGATPGWSLYNLSPAQAGDLAAVMRQASQQDWCAAEWLIFAKTADGWANALEETLAFRRCRFVSVYNWETIRANPAALAGLCRALLTQTPA